MLTVVSPVIVPPVPPQEMVLPWIAIDSDGGAAIDGAAAVHIFCYFTIGDGDQGGGFGAVSTDADAAGAAAAEYTTANRAAVHIYLSAAYGICITGMDAAIYMFFKCAAIDNCFERSPDVALVSAGYSCRSVSGEITVACRFGIKNQGDIPCYRTGVGDAEHGIGSLEFTIEQECDISVQMIVRWYCLIRGCAVGC